ARPVAATLPGRVSRETVPGPDGTPVVAENELITADVAARLAAAGRETVLVRSPLACRAAPGGCRLCYGVDRAPGALVEEGAAVGVVAAQSIGEPGSQLTLRTFHGGGQAGQDIADDLRRVTGLLDAVAPEPGERAVLAQVGGWVAVGSDEEVRRAKRPVRVTPLDARGYPAGPPVEHWVPSGQLLAVATADRVRAGDPLCRGTVAPRDLLACTGPDRAQQHLLAEIQAIYRCHGLEIDDKHFEVIIAQMFRKEKVLDPGETDLVPGQLVDPRAR